MKFQKHILSLMVGLLMVPSASLFAQATATQEKIDHKTVIANFIEATGGEMAHKAVESIVVNATMSVAAMNMEGKMYTAQNATHSYSKVDIPAFGSEATGHDGTTVWKVSDMTGPEIIDDARKDMTLRTSKLNTMLTLEEDNESVEYGGTEEFNGEECHVIVLKNGEEEPAYYYFSVESSLQMGTKITVVDPNQGAMEIVTKLSDYKEVAGVKIPHSSTADLPMGISMVTVIDSYEVNAEIDAKLFEFPEEIKELMNEKENEDK